MKGKSNYERTILILLAILAIGGSGWFIYQSMGFAATLETPTVVPKKEFGEVPIQNVETAINQALTPSKPWVPPSINNKSVPLNKSVLLVLKDEQIFDLALEDPLLRPPMSNSYLRENDLQFASPNVGELDADKDGFTNLEEFVAGTKPRDAKSHPPITNKLFLAGRIAHNFRITLKSSSTPLQIVTPDVAPPGKKNWFVDPGAQDSRGKSFGAGERFVALKLEKKVIPDPTTGEKDVSELTVEDTVTKQTFVLVKDKETDLATYEARFQFRLKVIADFTARKGATFRIPGYDATTYKVLDIQEDSAVIAPVNADGSTGKEVLIKKD